MRIFSIFIILTIIGCSLLNPAAGMTALFLALFYWMFRYIFHISSQPQQYSGIDFQNVNYLAISYGYRPPRQNPQKADTPKETEKHKRDTEIQQFMISRFGYDRTIKPKSLTTHEQQQWAALVTQLDDTTS